MEELEPPNTILAQESRRPMTPVAMVRCYRRIQYNSPRMLRNSQAAERRAPSATLPGFARATRGRRGVGGFPPLRGSAGEGGPFA